MIPKRIIYCWFGKGEKPPRILKCMQTWKEQLPDWEFIEINESNFDVNYNKYTKEAYKCKCYAFVSDVARLWGLYNYGGIYLDTDVIVHKPLDNFLKWDFFTGFEQPHYPVTATMGAVERHWLIEKMLDKYEELTFKKEDSWDKYITNTMIMSDILEKYFDRDSGEFQVKDNMAIYPQEVFCNRLRTQNEESYTEHLMSGMWGI